MRIGCVVVAVVAVGCGKGASSQGGSSVTPPGEPLSTAPANPVAKREAGSAVAPAPSDPCSNDELMKRGKMGRPPTLFESSMHQCKLVGVDEEVVSKAGIEKLVGRPLTTAEGFHVAFEVSKDRLPRIAKCERQEKIDWKTQRAWMTISWGVRPTQGVLQVDDGKTLTLVVHAGNHNGCGGRNDPDSYRATGVLVPADRKVEVVHCTIPNNCTGLEK
jgi:hypothetical protein